MATSSYWKIIVELNHVLNAANSVVDCWNDPAYRVDAANTIIDMPRFTEHMDENIKVLQAALNNIQPPDYKPETLWNRLPDNIRQILWADCAESVRDDVMETASDLLSKMDDEEIQNLLNNCNPGWYTDPEVVEELPKWQTEKGYDDESVQPDEVEAREHDNLDDPPF